MRPERFASSQDVFLQPFNGVDMVVQETELRELVRRLRTVGLEQISDMAIAAVSRDAQRVVVHGVSYVNNLRYARTLELTTKSMTRYEEFYIRSAGHPETNILLYQHYKQLKAEGKRGAFSVGGALDHAGKDGGLVICQVFDASLAQEVSQILESCSVVWQIEKKVSTHFGDPSVLIFASF